MNGFTTITLVVACFSLLTVSPALGERPSINMLNAAVNQLQAEVGQLQAENQAQQEQITELFQPVARKIKIPAGALSITGSGIDADKVSVLGGLTFSYPVNGSATAAVPMPEDWDGESDFTISLLFTPTSNGFLGVDFVVNVAGRRAGEDLIEPDQINAPGVVNIEGAGSSELFKDSFVIPADRFEPSDDVIHIFSIRRGGSGSSGTYQDPVRLLAVDITYTAIR